MGEAFKEPEWVRTCRVLGRLGEWEAVLRIYLPRWKANDPWIENTTSSHQWETILTRRYFEWYEGHKNIYIALRQELVDAKYGQ